MSHDESLIAVLEAAVAQSPQDHELKKHLASVYLRAGNADKALALYQSVLADAPFDRASLEGALQAAETLGESALVASFTVLLKSSAGAAAPATRDAKSDNESGPPKRVRGAQLRVVDGGHASEVFAEVEDSNVYLKDVGGMEAVKHRLYMAFLAPLSNPELMKAYGKSVKGGLMLYGPPGCGKTFIARALAGELGAKFIAIGIADILDMYVGESERKLHEVFELARRSAPCVLFFDELDALAQKRSHLRHSGMRSLVNQFLAEMDSIGANNEGVFVLAATNHPWDIDSALRRPGRFDRIIAVFPPDEEARKAILQYHLRGKPCGDIDVEALIGKTRGFSGADLAHLCESATESALEESIRTGQVRKITTDDFMQALKQIKPSTRSWLEHARNYAMFANEDGVYDDLLEYIGKALK